MYEIKLAKASKVFGDVTIDLEEDPDDDIDMDKVLHITIHDTEMDVYYIFAKAAKYVFDDQSLEEQKVN